VDDTGDHIHKIMDAHMAEIVKGDSAQTSDDADYHKIKSPLIGMGEFVGMLS